jgi:hypothetical protein
VGVADSAQMIGMLAGGCWRLVMTDAGRVTFVSDTGNEAAVHVVPMFR